MIKNALKYLWHTYVLGFPSARRNQSVLSGTFPRTWWWVWCGFVGLKAALSVLWITPSIVFLKLQSPPVLFPSSSLVYLRTLVSPQSSYPVKDSLEKALIDASDSQNLEHTISTCYFHGEVLVSSPVTVNVGLLCFLGFFPAALWSEGSCFCRGSVSLDLWCLGPVYRWFYPCWFWFTPC